MPNNNRKYVPQTPGSARRSMRKAALAYRKFVEPKAFDGTLATYNRNIWMACECLQKALTYRKLSHKYATL